MGARLQRPATAWVQMAPCNWPDRDTGRPRGFGFVEMPDATEAQAAIAGLNGASLGGRPLTVNEARPREERGGPRRGPRW